MRIKLAVLVLLSLVLFAHCGSKADDSGVKKARKTQVEPKMMNLDEVEEDAGFHDPSDDEDEEEEEVIVKKPPKKQKITPKKTKSKAKPAEKEKEKEDEISEEEKESRGNEEENYVYQACNAEKSPNNELCHCDQNEINCNSIVMDFQDPKLRTLNLVIQQKDFKPYTANFSENGIMRLKTGEVLPGFEKFVSKFDLSYNEIRYMDSDVFKRFTNLTWLNLDHNNLQTIKKSVFNAAKKTLHRLELGYNRIKTLEDNVFDGLENLITLSLDGNKISSWRKEYFKGLDNLEKLSLDNCGISDLPGDIFEYLPKLKELSLRGNPMEEIPSVVANLKSLKDVDMSETSLTEIRDHAFAGDSDLELIILQNMGYLTVIRDCAFCGLPKLEKLYINDNKKLVEIHENAFGFIKSDPGHKAAAINEFDMHNGNVSTISEQMLDYDKLDVFRIGENPWQCNCKVQFLMDNKFTFKSDSVTPKCAGPEDMKDRHLESLRAVEACEDARFLGRSGRFSTVLGLVLLVGFIACGGFYLYSSGKLMTWVRKVRKEPDVTYTNLQNAGEDFALEADFQPRPAEV